MDGITEHTCSAKPCTCFCTLTFLHMLTHHTTSFTWHFLISCWKHLCQVPSLIHYRLFSCVSTLLVHYTVLSPLNRQGRNCFKSLACLEILSIANVLRGSLGNSYAIHYRYSQLSRQNQRWVRHVGPHGAQLVDKDTGKLHWIPEAPLWHALPHASAGLSSHRLWRWPSHVHCQEGIFLTNTMAWSLSLTFRPYYSTAYPFMLKYFADKSWTGFLTNVVWERCF